MKTLFTRLFITNWKTTGAGLLVVIALAGRWTGKLEKDEAQYLIGVAVAAGLFAAKDGVREDTVVAPEDVPGPNTPEQPNQL